MAFNISKVAHRLLTSIGKSPSLLISNRIVCKSVNDVNISSRAFTRSLWYAINPARGGTHGMNGPPEVGGGGITIAGPSKLCTCGCAGLHTEGDKELARFLEDEIKLEKNNQKNNVPQVDGFDQSFSGSSVTLLKKDNGEKVVVSFNVNHSVEADERSVEGEDEEPMMRSYPDFNVEITKDSQPTLSLKCSFSTDLNEGGEEDVGDDQPEDQFIIDEVSVYKDSASDDVYIVGSEVMDGDLYDLLMNMLEERGIDDRFTDQLCDLATSVEHSQYIDFLQHLKNIAKG